MPGLLSVLQKIIDITWRQSNHDTVKLARWIRCLFQLALTVDEAMSLICLERATEVAAAESGVCIMFNNGIVTTIL
jgi:hypothetical protein